ncbi:MAG: hypothetical protein EON58_10405 [Alphaproteobacteria bacterium]|nr:MAG: hypothetical protein EON58_10405 [Alphaproteobacteria bacterium]
MRFLALSHWFAIRAAVRSERTAERELRLAGFDVYLPEQKIERFYRRKRVKVISELCLFPGYLFVQMERDQFRAAKSSRGVVDILPGFPHEPMPMPRRDVEDLRAALAAMKLDDTDEARRHRGETVKTPWLQCGSGYETRRCGSAAASSRARPRRCRRCIRSSACASCWRASAARRQSISMQTR